MLERSPHKLDTQRYTVDVWKRLAENVNAVESPPPDLCAGVLAKIPSSELFAENAHLSGAALSNKDVGVSLQANNGKFCCGSGRKKVWWVQLAPPQFRRHVCVTMRVLQTCALIGDISVIVEKSNLCQMLDN